MPSQEYDAVGRLVQSRDCDMEPTSVWMTPLRQRCKAQGRELSEGMFWLLYS